MEVSAGKQEAQKHQSPHGGGQWLGLPIVYLQNDPAESASPTQAKNARFEPRRSFACAPLPTACIGTPQESCAYG
jgi:hypothetical protein